MVYALQKVLVCRVIWNWDPANTTAVKIELGLKVILGNYSQKYLCKPDKSETTSCFGTIIVAPPAVIESEKQLQCKSFAATVPPDPVSSRIF